MKVKMIVAVMSLLVFMVGCGKSLNVAQNTYKNKTVKTIDYPEEVGIENSMEVLSLYEKVLSENLTYEEWRSYFSEIPGISFNEDSVGFEAETIDSLRQSTFNLSCIKDSEENLEILNLDIVLCGEHDFTNDLKSIRESFGFPKDRHKSYPVEDNRDFL